MLWLCLGLFVLGMALRWVGLSMVARAELLEAEARRLDA